MKFHWDFREESLWNVIKRFNYEGFAIAMPFRIFKLCRRVSLENIRHYGQWCTLQLAPWQFTRFNVAWTQDNLLCNWKADTQTENLVSIKSYFPLFCLFVCSVWRRNTCNFASMEYVFRVRKRALSFHSIPMEYVRWFYRCWDYQTLKYLLKLLPDDVQVKDQQLRVCSWIRITLNG